MVDNILFNPIYVLKPDSGRALLLPTSKARRDLMVNSNSEFIVHPIHAVILNFLCGDKYEIAIQKIVSYLKVKREFVDKFVSSLLDNKEYISFKDSKLGISYIFPPYTIITKHKGMRDMVITADTFMGNGIDVRRKRHLTPSNLTLMLNNKCVTDCFYCYADKRTPINCSIPFERLEAIIKEAKLLNVNNFDVIGGEFFLYRDWERLLSELYKYGYNPYLSTKMPLDEISIKKMVNVGAKELQISLDTLIPENLRWILNVGEKYVNDIKKTLVLLNKYHIDVVVHTILTSRNDSVGDMESIFDFISSFDNIINWKIDIASPALYKNISYEEIRPRNNNLEMINIFFSNIKHLSRFPILQDVATAYFNINQDVDRKEVFKKRATCSANYSGFFILPDGNVTICEELYWHEHFIIGNIKEQGLLDIWNSNKALGLFYMSKDDIQNDSKCSQCGIFNQCRQGKGVCWKAIIGVHGKDKWYYPDPLCV